MKIAIDLRWISYDTGGIRRYVLSLVENLAEIDKKNQYLLVFDDYRIIDRVMKEQGLENRENVSTEVFAMSPFSLKSQLKLPGFLKKNNVELFHSPDFIAPLFMRGIKLIITMHDLIPYLFPELCPHSKKVKLLPLYRMFNRMIMKKSSRVITVSENSKRDIVHTFNVDENKIVVIPNAVSRACSVIENKSRVESVKRKFKLAKRNILYVGRQDPSKNLIGLIEAFKILKDKHGFDGSLVIAGKKDERYPEPFKLVNKYSMWKNVIFTGYIYEEELPLLYNACDLFVFPSFYEGFGLPPLEAMACGVPVVSSEMASLREVVGDAGLLVRPDDAIEMAGAMNRLLNDEALRKEMISRGLQRAKLFSWKDAARQTLAEYERAR